MLRDSPARSFANPNEEALHAFCKQTLKSRLFRGFYKERCYVDAVNGYRDLIVLHHSEKELKKILQDIKVKLVRFYENESFPVWIGINNCGAVPGPVDDICIWVELDEIAFDQYWFTIKAVRFRENEIIIKVKPVRVVEVEPEIGSIVRLADGLTKTPDAISLQDFVEVIMGWGSSIKRTVYEFMSNDISKDNLKAALKFFSLIAISLLSASVQAVRFIGIFTIRFLIEFRRLVVVTTPIFMRIIDLCSKIIGGFYILLAMIWRDATGPKVAPRQQQAITYNRPEYQRLKIKYRKNSSQDNFFRQ